MANWLFGAKPKQQIEIIKRDPCRLRLEEWQTQPDLVKMAQKVLSDQRFKLMLDCAQMEHPGNVNLVNVPMDERAAWQLRGEGYNMALANLSAMGTLQQPKHELEPTFEAPEPEHFES